MGASLSELFRTIFSLPKHAPKTHTFLQLERTTVSHFLTIRYSILACPGASQARLWSENLVACCHCLFCCCCCRTGNKFTCSVCSCTAEPSPVQPGVCMCVCVWVTVLERQTERDEMRARAHARSLTVPFFRFRVVVCVRACVCRALEKRFWRWWRVIKHRRGAWAFLLPASKSTGTGKHVAARVFLFFTLWPGKRTYVHGILCFLCCGSSARLNPGTPVCALLTYLSVFTVSFSRRKRTGLDRRSFHAYG